MKVRGRPTSIPEDDILDAARDLFLQRGLDATTAEIAERAGISESIIFYRYKTKEALFAAVVERLVVVPPELERLTDHVGKGELAETLFDVAAGMVAAMDQVLPFMMMAWSSPSRLAQFCAKMREPNPAHVRTIKLIASYFDAEARAGRLRAVDPEILARGFLGGIIDYVMQQHLHGADSLPMPTVTFLRGFVNILLDGARPHVAAAPKPGGRR
jgi:AcrR family transcriptional regulator